MNPKAIHEVQLSSIVNIAKSAGQSVANVTDKERRKVKKYGERAAGSYSSIAKATSGLTMVFPVICSSSISIDAASMITKAIERRSITMLQILLAATQLTNCANLMEYIESIHTNLNVNKMDLDEFIEFMGDLPDNIDSIKGGYKNAIDTYSETYVDANTLRDINEDCRTNLNYYFESDISDRSLNDFTYINNYGISRIVESSINEAKKGIYNDPSHLKYIDDDKFKSLAARNKEFRDIKKSEREEKKFKLDKEKNKREIEKNERDREKNEREIERNERDKEKFNYDIIRADREIIQNRLVPSEVKKANEVNPSLMIINWIGGDKRMQSVVGVKAKLLPVSSNEILARIITKNADSNILLKLVRASTREISFAKDFIFAIDNAKIDALAKSKRGSSSALFKTLERRALSGKIRKAIGSNNYSKCITTLVISQEEVEQLSKYNNIDVNIPRVIIPIMEKLNLLYFVIVDETAETVKILIDGETEYEVYPYDSLERESGDTGYKKAINLMTRLSR